MENLSREEALAAKKTFRAQELPQELENAISTIGLFVIQRSPEVWGVRIGVSEALDHAAILEHFPPKLHENVCIENIGQVIRYEDGVAT